MGLVVGGEQTIGSGGFCAKFDFIGWAQIAARCGVCVSEAARPEDMQDILAGARNAFGLGLVLLIGLFESQTGTCCEGKVKVWRRIVSAVLCYFMATSAHWRS